MAITVAQLQVEIGADLHGADRALQTVSDRLAAVGQQAAKVGAWLNLGLTAPLGLLAKTAIGTAMEYQSALNLMQAVSGATAEQMRAVAQTAKALGADLSLPATSAADAATAMVELAKAGLSVEQTMKAAKGVLQLAAAGNLSNAQAAEIAANALNAFSLAGERATDVANLLAAAANASSAEVTDIADALKMASAVFASAGISIEDLVAAIGQMANAGIKGSDAGTSLKQMILSLQAPSQKASNLMADLGIQIYNAQGRMLPFGQIIEQFSTRLARLSQEERNAALATIFGSDAVRAANIVLMAGTKAHQDMLQAVTRQGAAAELAGARMKGLAGALQGLQSQIETVMLDVAEPFLNTLEGLVRGLADLVPKISEIDPNLRNAALAFMAVLAAAGPVLVLFGALAAAVSFLLSPIGLVTVALAGLAAAFAGNLANLRAVVQQVVQGDLAGAWQTLVANLQGVTGLLRDAVGRWGQALLAWIGPTVAQLPRALAAVTAAIGAWVQAQAAALPGQLTAWKDTFLVWTGTVASEIGGSLQGVIEAVRGWIVAHGPDILDQLASWTGAFQRWARDLGARLGEAIGQVDLGLIGASIAAALSQVTVPPFRLTLAGVTVTDTSVEQIARTIGQQIAAALGTGTLGEAVQRIVGAIASVVGPVVGTIERIVGLVLPRIMPTFAAFGAAIGQTAAQLSPFVTTMLPMLARLLGDLATIVTTIVLPALGGFALLVGAGLFAALNTLAHVLAAVLPDAVMVAAGAIQMIVGIVTLAADVIAGVVRILAAVLRGDLGGAWQEVQSLVAAVVADIVAIVTGFAQIVVGIVKGLVDAVIGFFRGLWVTLVGGSIIPDLVNAIIGWLQSLLGVWTSLWSAIVDQATGLVDGFVGTVIGLIDRARVALIDGLGAALGWLQAQTAAWFSAGRQLVQSLVAGIRSLSIPVPRFDLAFEAGPLGAQVPRLSVGIDWKALADLIPALAEGGRILRSGLALVGERGPEVVALPRGAAVAPLLPAPPGALVISVTVVPQGPVLTETDLADAVAEQLRRRLQSNARLAFA